ncbi:triafestin-1-like isoform X1 [Rhodnius prolixus]|uniref:Putative triabin-like lipocalin n=2 Tax=Rhodnius prolixus TaxID=13249 RepID=R4G3G4_RHOPR
MEKLVAVIFLGLVMSTIAQQPPQRPNFLAQCQSVTEKSGFNKEQFFSGDWFVTHAKDGTESTLCRKYTTSVNSGGKSVVQYGYNRYGKERKVSCTQKNENSQAPYIFDCEVKEDEQTVLKYEVQKTILETDGNSALLYRCLQVGTQYIDTFLVLNRDAGGAVSQDVKNAISAQNVNFENLLTRTSYSCT